MARNMKLVTGKCACCGAKVTMNVAEYTEEDDKMLNIMEYFDYKFVSINYCENCGYTNSNLTKLVGENTRKIVASEEYQNAVDDGYIDGYEDLPYQEYEDMAVGEYDAMAMIYKKEGKTNTITYAKLQNRIAELKSVLRGQYYENLCDSYDDDEERTAYQELVNVLTSQINEANNECYQALKSVKLMYPYEVIFVAECLAKLEKFKKARELIEGVEANFNIDEELKEYIDEFLTEVEKI